MVTYSSLTVPKRRQEVLICMFVSTGFRIRQDSKAVAAEAAMWSTEAAAEAYPPARNRQEEDGLLKQRGQRNARCLVLDRAYRSGITLGHPANLGLSPIRLVLMSPSSV